MKKIIKQTQISKTVLVKLIQTDEGFEVRRIVGRPQDAEKLNFISDRDTLAEAQQRFDEVCEEARQSARISA